MHDESRIPLPDWREYPPEEMAARARAYADEASRRRTVRDFDTRPVPDEVLRHALRAAGSAPSGANQQPWYFVVVRDPALKARIRRGAEEEEREFYGGRAPEEWLDALSHLGTDADKPFLETAPALIAIFQQRWSEGPDGERVKHYYPTESVGLASGMLIAALHHAGLATLTHTPSPMTFLNRILDRPANEKPFLLLVVGYPAPGVTVPDIERKSLDDIATFLGDAE